MVQFLRVKLVKLIFSISVLWDLSVPKGTLNIPCDAMVVFVQNCCFIFSLGEENRSSG